MKTSVIVCAASLLFPMADASPRASTTRRSHRSSSPPTRLTSTLESWRSPWRPTPRQEVRAARDHRSHRRQQIGDGTREQAQGHAGGQSHEPEPEIRRREEHRKISRRLRMEAFNKAYIDREVAYHQQVIDALDKTLIPEAQERGVEGVARQSAPGVCRAPRGCQSSSNHS